MKPLTGPLLPIALALALGGCKQAETKLASPMPAAAATSPAPAGPGVVAITPATSSIEFTGSTALQSHPGHFEAFEGTIEMPGDDPKAAAIHVVVEMNSTATKIPLLTKHLKAEDFFDVAHYPRAEFASSTVSPTSQSGVYDVDGLLTLHGISRQVTFPARIAVSPDELTLDGTIVVRQTDFGMTESARKTKDEVPIRIAIKARRR